MLAKIQKRRGQATIELALALPFLIWLIFYTFNAFHTMHTGHVAQKYAALSLYDRLGNRAKFVVDDRDYQLHGKEFMSVRYLDPDGNSPSRKILVGPTKIDAVVGICREPIGLCKPK